MKIYTAHPGHHIEGLAQREVEPALLGPGDVRVRTRAVTLNYRDLMVVSGNYDLGDDPVVPVSDGAGEVVAVGTDVHRLAVGDRVIGSFFPDWIEGEPDAWKTKAALGGSLPGLLAEEVVLDQDAWVRAPAHLDFAEAAALPCAGLTAWNALFESGAWRPGERVLLLGTGGVSIWGLQLAHAAGLETIVTSSSDAKLDRARALGADHVVNYQTRLEWDREVLDATRGEGVHRVVEVGGKGTLPRSVATLRSGGTLALVGGLAGFDGAIGPRSLILGAKRAFGVFVGSRKMLQELARFVEAKALRPVIDTTFDFDDARAAYAHLESGRHFGKVAVAVG
jgi:NADPH:quinone reductase-like Zn-dependent oxidoreductase